MKCILVEGKKTNNLGTLFLKEMTTYINIVNWTNLSPQQLTIVRL